MMKTAGDPKIRADLDWSAQADQSRWVVRDPLTANFFSFNEVERAALMLMNGRRCWSEILGCLKLMFPGTSVDSQWLNTLLSRLQMHHLLVSNSAANAKRLVRIRQLQPTRGLLQQLMSPLAIRIPLVDPTIFIKRLGIPAAILFHPWMVRSWLMAGLCLLFLVLREFLGSTFTLSLDLRSIQGDRWLILFLCYLFAKSLHELGHALACVHRKTECNEVGLMLLCLAPCLYCDTTDSWKLSSKWHRAGIAAAGMYVELVIASMAAVVWLLTKEGTLHYVAASLMIVCSVGTILVNSNPLLKYDGYYILSDLWGVPNLFEQSREAFRSLILSWLTGRPINNCRFDANVWLLAGYSLLSSVYRCFVLGLILWISWTVLVPLGLGLAAVALTTAMLLGMALGQIRSLKQFYREIIATASIRLLRLVVFSGCLLALIAFVIGFPLPSHVRSRAVTDFEDKLPLFASQSSELVFAAPTGVRLPSGSQLLQLDSPESEFELASLRGEIAVLEKELEQLRLRSSFDQATAYRIPSILEKLTESRAREKLLEREIAALSVRAPKPGYLLADRASSPRAITAPRDDRFGTPALEPAHTGCNLERSTLVAWFSNKQQLLLNAIIPASEVKSLVVGMHVAIQWDSDLTSIASGRIIRIAPEAVIETPPELIADPSLISTRGDNGRYCPETPHYEVSIRVESSNLIRLRGAPATIQIRKDPKTLMRRAIDYVRENLKPLY